MGDTYSPHLEGVGEGFSSPKARTPLRATPHLLLDTPYITNLRTLLAEALNRPVTVFNKQRHYLFTWAMESVILPVVVVSIYVKTVQLSLSPIATNKPNYLTFDAVYLY